MEYLTGRELSLSLSNMTIELKTYKGQTMDREMHGPGAGEININISWFKRMNIYKGDYKQGKHHR